MSFSSARAYTYSVYTWTMTMITFGFRFVSFEPICWTIQCQMVHKYDKITKWSKTTHSAMQTTWNLAQHSFESFNKTFTFSIELPSKLLILTTSLDKYILEICDMCLNFQIIISSRLQWLPSALWNLPLHHRPSNSQQVFFFFKQKTNYEQIIMLLLDRCSIQEILQRICQPIKSWSIFLKHICSDICLTFQNFSLIAFNFQHECASAGWGGAEKGIKIFNKTFNNVLL